MGMEKILLQNEVWSQKQSTVGDVLDPNNYKYQRHGTRDGTYSI